jgi:hypothetical protein
MRCIGGLCALVIAGVLTACSGAGSTAGHPNSPASAGASPGSSASSAAEQMPSETPSGAAASSASPTDTALRLQALLGEHSILASEMMRARIRADAGLADAANSALSTNAAAMSALLTPILPASAREQFATAWGEHIQALFNYARGLSVGDATVRSTARTDLVKYDGQLAEFFVAHSQGRLSRTAALDAVRMHIDQLLAGADAYAAKNYTASANQYRLSYSHTFDLGAVLARSFLPAKAAADLGSPTAQLRSALTKLLGEHVALVIAAMRSTVSDPAGLAALGAAVNANTADLTGAIDSLFGATAAKGFQALWADHVDQLMAYARATAQHDSAGQERARFALRSFEQSFAGYLNGATQSRLGRPALAQAFVMHDRELLAEIDAYAAKSFSQAQDLSDQTYQDMFMVSGQLAGAIGATLAGRLPRGGSQTGGGGMARVVERR